MPPAIRTAKSGKRSLIIVPTRALARALKADINEIEPGAAATHQDEAHRHAKIVCTCPESLYKFAGSHFSFIAIDEANEVVKRVQAGQLGKAPEQSAIAFESLLSRATTVVVSTADLNQWALYAVQNLSRITARDTHIQKVRRPDTAMGVTVYGNFYHWLSEIIAHIEQGLRVSIPVGSQEKGQIIHKLLTDDFGASKKGFVLDAKETPAKVRSLFLEGPNEFLADGCYDWFIFSPVINSGVSIEGQFFDTQFEYSTPHEGALSVSQRGERVRSAIGRDGAITERHIYFSEQGAPTLEAYPELLRRRHWEMEMQAEDKAPLEKAAAMAGELGARRAIEPIKARSLVRAEQRSELSRMLCLDAYDVFFKRELLQAEWEGYGWDVSPAPAPTPEDKEKFAALRAACENIEVARTKEKGERLQRATAQHFDSGRGCLYRRGGDGATGQTGGYLRRKLSRGQRL